jgi:thiol-disulfide isomerase/thioredoxin
MLLEHSSVQRNTRRVIAVAGLLIGVVVAEARAQESSASTVTRLTGQIICCKDCWGEKDRTKIEFGTADDRVAAAGCLGNGDIAQLVVMDSAGASKFYQLEARGFKPTAGDWLPYIGRRVVIVGPLRAEKKTQILTVDSLMVVAPAIGEAEEARADSIRKADSASVPAGELVLTDLLGATQKLSGYRGKIVVLNFWATYCVPCVKEMPILVHAQAEYGAYGVQVIGAAADPMEDREKVVAFARKAKITFPLWLGASTGDMSRFGLSGVLPGTVILGRDGETLARFPGEITATQLKQALDSIVRGAALAKLPDTIPPTTPHAKPASSVPS